MAKKRMEDIPEPVTVGTVDLTQEQLEKGKKTLEKLIEESMRKMAKNRLSD